MRSALRSAREHKGLEPDECFIFGTASKRRPDLAIEVVVSSTQRDKLPIYRALQVPEVWIWKQDIITVHALRRGIFRSVKRSVVLPRIDFAALSEALKAPRAMLATQRFRASYLK